MERFDKILRWMERLCSAVAALMLLTIMLVATLDVALRYFFNSPLGWSYDLISLYLMAGMFFFAMSDTLRAHGHIAVDLLHSHMTHRQRHAVEVPGYFLVLLTFLAVTWLAAGKTIDAYRGGDVIAGRFDWPTWISMSFVAVGFFVLSLRCAHRLMGHLLSALQGRSVIELPPIAGKEDV
ncbi:MAG: hypothetical protein RI949_1680 [Pseudomonadota bacterium]|jgi:TRAP-type C4-dicarboxylate transport system permease small subunit